MKDKALCGLLGCLLLLSMKASALEPEVQAAKDEGMRLYNIQHSTAALSYLEQAAEAGDVEAMYYMGEAERRQSMMNMTRAALDWYLKAAEHGEPYAMLRLFQGGACVAGDECPEDAEGWREKALAETLPKAEGGDAEAMLALYYIYGALDDSDEGNEWLEKAAEAGNSEAKDRLAKMIRDGYGFYWSDESRLEAAEKLARQAAEQGHVPAMRTLSSMLEEQGEDEESWEWEFKASEAGMLDARLGVAWCYLNPDSFQEFGGGQCLVERDPVKGWAILYAMRVEVGDHYPKNLMERNRDLLTYDQRQEAEALAEDEWLNHGSPLSTFPPKYGF
ncbi:tetratricopeptide repeat protein [Halomonas koreensis]|uniref:Tetratricopeptide repeat protein n=1 Tax=Halomonas koreensis TaxID=245385 RepID=A0ABU1G6X6_9GAMM|nr:tetratricopeptide repeat protein [Halomonas koreensis]MDR5868670.1 tetratricopeptide repeat protein [Halomonas koreensis]